MNRISPKRAATVKLRHNSTFGTKAPKKKVLTIDELKSSGLLTKASRLSHSKTSRAKAKKEADKWFSEFIRLRDAGPDGYATCITNPNIRKHWRDMDCGHWISRAKESTRYDERNCNAQSKQSNRFQGGHFLEHGLAIDRKFGPGTRAELERKAGQVCKRTVEDYVFLADTYKRRVLWIKEHEPEKYFRKTTS